MSPSKCVLTTLVKQSEDPFVLLAVSKLPYSPAPLALLHISSTMFALYIVSRLRSTMTSHIKLTKHIFAQQIVIEKVSAGRENQLNLNGKSITNIFPQPFHAIGIADDRHYIWLTVLIFKTFYVTDCTYHPERLIRDVEMRKGKFLTFSHTHYDCQ